MSSVEKLRDLVAANGLGAVGGVFRDAKGEWVARYFTGIGYSSTLQVELWAVVDGLGVALEKGFLQLLVELDSDDANHLINSTQAKESNLKLIVISFSFSYLLMSSLLSTSSSIPRQKEYDVFLSFRGEDTRHHFTDHLYDALRRSGIVTFRDDPKLEAGQEIAPELFKAIQQSWCSVIVFSENYVFSGWCLEELAEIVKQKEENGHKVFPIFYGVDPSDLRKQKEKVEAAFAKHEERYKEDEAKIRRWRNALTEVANIKGWHSNNREMSETLTLSTDAFMKMKRLRLLKILCQSNCCDLTYLSNELRLLDWMGCPLRSLPSSFKPENLVILLLPYSNIEQLWKENIPLYKLKVLNLKGSENLIKAPDFTTAPNIEILVLEGCTRLVYVHPSVGVLTRLKLLNLRGCKSLRSFPTKIGMESLQQLILSGCSKLQSFPVIDGKMECLLELCFDGTNIKELPFSIGNLRRLKVLNLKDCKSLRSLPIKFGMKSLEVLILSGLSSLTRLNLRDCNLCEGDIPSDISRLSSLEELDLGGNNFISIPSCVTRISNLKFLKLSDCRALKSLPELPTSIGGVRINGCPPLEIVANPSKVCNSSDRSDIVGVNCFRLVENIDALTLLKKHLKVFGNSSKIFDIIIPESEMPEWFSQQRGDSSIKIDLPLEVRNGSQWMGVALCCIFVSDDASRDERLVCRAVIHDRYSGQANCTQSNFQGRDHREVDWSGWGVNYHFERPVIKDHIFIRYFTRDKLYPIPSEDKCGERESNNLWTAGCLDQECHQLELSFEESKSVKVKKCGVRIVYERDLEEMEQIQELHSSQCCANFDDIQQHPADDGSIGQEENPFGEEESTTPKKIFQALNQTVETLSNIPPPELALQLFLQCAEAASDCDLEPVAYEFFTQAYILYEEEISEVPFISLNYCVIPVYCMGLMRNPRAFLQVVQTVLKVTCHRFILFTAGYEPLDAAVQEIAHEASSISKQRWLVQKGLSLFDNRLFCFSGGSTAAALYAGIPQVDTCDGRLAKDYMSVCTGSNLLGRKNVLAWSCSRTIEKKPSCSRK
ncbi:TMV resistance protein N-like [Gossypium australe]|uniref:TMV resistance protein N-like n=1 Tax=Gossypium australe TaxID=47621 RepID=A0A5B6VTE7_9ROSI|nr:TMV resistance protein N-like [Gossypium australe]